MLKNNVVEMKNTQTMQQCVFISSNRFFKHCYIVKLSSKIESPPADGYNFPGKYTMPRPTVFHPAM